MRSMVSPVASAKVDLLLGGDELGDGLVERRAKRIVASLLVAPEGLFKASTNRAVFETSLGVML